MLNYFIFLVKMQLTKEGQILLEYATTLKHDDIFKKRFNDMKEKHELILEQHLQLVNISCLILLMVFIG